MIDIEQEIDAYKLVVAPMLYMLRPGVAERIETFVRSGGTFVATYWSGIVNETDLCFLGGFPGPLRPVLGIWNEEIDALVASDRNAAAPVAGNSLGLSQTYAARELCALIHTETASVLATYQDDFYAGRPAITVNTFGGGEAYYLAFRTDVDALTDFYSKLADRLRLKPALETALPDGVTATMRSDGQKDFVFVMNFAAEDRAVKLDNRAYTDKLSGEAEAGTINLAPYGIRILERETETA